MKRDNIFKVILVFLTVLTLMLFSGCGIIMPENLELDKAYTLTATVKYGASEDVSVSLNRTASGSWNGILNEPFALQGIAVSYSGGSVTLSRENMSVQPSDKGSVSVKLLLDALESGFSDSSGENAGKSIKTAGSSIEITGTNQNGEYILSLDKETYFPVSVTVTAHKLTAVFTGVTATEFETAILNDFDDFADFAE